MNGYIGREIVILMFAGFLMGASVCGILYESTNLFGDDVSCNSCDMRFNITNSTGVNGFYSVNNYFCVWTKDRTSEEIASTTFHELTHYFNYGDKREHFSKDFDKYNYSDGLKVLGTD